MKQQGTDVTLVFVDTEGIGSVQQDQGYDAKIFSLGMNPFRSLIPLAILLSSYFIYNSMGVIDESALSNLSFIVNLTKHISTKCTTS